VAKFQATRLAAFLLIISFAISGINSPVVRYGLATIPTPLFGFLRMIIPLLILTPFFMLTKHKPLKIRQIALAMLFGFTIYFAANGLFYLGVQRSGAVNAAIIGLLEPLFLFTFSVEVMREKFNGRILAGIAIALGGSLLIVFGPMIALQDLSFSGSLTGNLLLVGCSLCSVFGVWIAKIALKQLDRIQLLFWSLVSGTTLYGLLSFGQWGQIPGIFQNPGTASAVLFGAIFNGLFTYLFAFYAVKRLKGEEYGIFEYVNPAVAAVVAVIFFGEKFTPILLLGVAIIFTGLYLAEAHRGKKAQLHHHLLRGR